MEKKKQAKTTKDECQTKNKRKSTISYQNKDIVSKLFESE